MAFRRRNNRDNESDLVNLEEWAPKTQLGKDVKEKKVTSIEQIFNAGKKIEEIEIVYSLLPNMKSEVIDISSVQRMTKNNRKQKFRVTVVVGDMRGHVGVGSAKDIEVKKAIDNATKNAKMNVIPVVLGCGSWQCTCGTSHSLPFNAVGKCGSVEVTLKPAPRGLGIVASAPVKKMLELAGVKDIWSFSRGRTRSKYNTLLAVQRAFESTISMKNLTPEEVAYKPQAAESE
ncbi:30S ribosomal protein S5p [Candidatus Mancarchaeum acidiphilum]|uniref:Small ribosomal subunit protein uS5 n=1 Tax=Candidatus Mancarchaeum acidiphilum TaxID=1920749 RepID=A0A218NLR6_9ARCH|nr:30S ribosomal protein S5 [Candidatus Mancarchaeum acidiphilum]ASI13420.1 30S ribosomal protein S5p [Candidatus Mancarchaeum acidiphilum]